MTGEPNRAGALASITAASSGGPPVNPGIDPVRLPVQPFGIVPSQATRAFWWAQVRAVAPLAPTWFNSGLTRLLAAPELNSDALLIVADALVEAGSIAEVVGHAKLGEQLRQLADLPRALAPSRADPKVL